MIDPPAPGPLDAITVARVMLAGVRHVPGWAGYYATSEGQILSVRRGAPRILATTAHPTRGHLKVKLYRPDLPKGEDHYVHRLVCLAWHGPPPSEDCDLVRHFPDQNPTNNRPGNLLWGTDSQNQRDRIWATPRLIDEINYWERFDRVLEVAGTLGVYIEDPRYGF